VSRLAGAFRSARAKGRPALVAYLMAGDPSLKATESFALACEAGGADILELGIPFSDPIADGPEIQRAGERARASGTRPRDVIELAARLRRKTQIPLVLMTYMNPIEAFGPAAFADAAAAAGVDGVIVPDLSLEESAPVAGALERRGIDHIQLVAPSTPDDRARAIGLASRGFLYAVARYGTTGMRSALPPELGARIAALKRVTSLPLAIGFGVSSSDHVRALAGLGADGIVVGSAIVQRVAEDPSPGSVERFVSDLASGLRAPTSPALRDSSS
jgi:tryptophan synthase alpha chain